LWNCGSVTPNEVPLTHCSHVRHSPEAEPPAISPISRETPTRIHRLYGAIDIRYRSRFCCSIDMALNGGRSRCASQMLKPTASVIRTPKTRNISVRVSNSVRYTLV
jgi:hypothetical protein